MGLTALGQLLAEFHRAMMVTANGCVPLTHPTVRVYISSKNHGVSVLGDELARCIARQPPAPFAQLPSNRPSRFHIAVGWEVNDLAWGWPQLKEP